MSPGRADPSTVRRHLLALDEILTHLARHAGRGLDVLAGDLDERWAVERGLQLCTQCVLDIATHLVASAGRDAPDYASAIAELGRLGMRWCTATSPSMRVACTECSTATSMRSESLPAT